MAIVDGEVLRKSHQQHGGDYVYVGTARPVENK